LFTPQQRADMLARRARRFRQKGELRHAVVALREACALSDGDAARWMMLGDLHVRLGQRGEAERAMKQALFLRERSGEPRKAQVIRSLLSRLESMRDGPSSSARSPWFSEPLAVPSCGLSPVFAR
jgi:predicted Zn-dependent protease